MGFVGVILREDYYGCNEDVDVVQKRYGFYNLYEMVLERFGEDEVEELSCGDGEYEGDLFL